MFGRYPAGALSSTRRRVGTHDDLAVYHELGVQDLLPPFSRDELGRGRAFVRKHDLDTAAETIRIELERLFALSAEKR